jgi:hypothetical protein
LAEGSSRSESGAGRKTGIDVGLLTYGPMKSMPPSRSFSQDLRYFAVVSGALLAIFLLASRLRLVDGDEGFYLLGARLVLEHKMPYRDFLHLQTPLLPYFYALWMKFIGVGWHSARGFGAILTTTVGILLYLETYAQTGKRLGGLAAAGLFASAGTILAWFPIAKTYAMSDLFLFLAYMAITRLGTNWPFLAALLSGILTALSADSRLYFAGLAPVFFLWIWFYGGRGVKLLAAAAWLAGFSVGLLPNLYFYLQAPSAFVFDNLGYHAIRSEHGLIGNFGEKAIVVARFFLFGGSEGNGVQVEILLLSAALCFWFLRRLRPASALAFALAAVLAFLCILPTPTLFQYYCVVVPFLIVGVVPCVSDLLDSFDRQLPSNPSGQARAETSWSSLPRVFVAMLFLIYVSQGASDARDYLGSGVGVPGIGGHLDAVNFKVSSVQSVSRALDQIAQPGERVISFWPGYLFASKASPLPGTENNFGAFVAGRLDPEQRIRYHIVDDSEIAADMARHTPRIVIVGPLDDPRGGPVSDLDAHRAALSAAGYQVVRTIDGVFIYVYRDSR